MLRQLKLANVKKRSEVLRTGNIIAVDILFDVWRALVLHYYEVANVSVYVTKNLIHVGLNITSSKHQLYR